MQPSQALDTLQLSQPLSIIRITESLASSNDDPSPTKANGRTSDVSIDTASSQYEHVDLSPASLRADLTHYQELFSKLRFSYIEQVTKEKFLRAITAEDPVFVEPSENAELERRLGEEKSALTLQKDEVARMSKELEEKGRELALRHEGIQLQTRRLEGLPNSIANLEAAITLLREDHSSPIKSTNPDLNMPLDETRQLLAARQRELAALEAQTVKSQRALLEKTNEAEKLQGEMVPLLNQKRVMVQVAREARQRKEGGGVDELEERGRWYKASEGALRAMLDV